MENHVADDFTEIARRLKEIVDEKQKVRETPADGEAKAPPWPQNSPVAPTTDWDGFCGG